MQNITDKLLTEFRLPEINGARCVHAHIETATCQACVTACPEDAWILDDESLGLNTEACDGCGLCVPACPEGAILQTLGCTIREERGSDNNHQKVLLLGCEKNGLAETNCKCIHSISYTEILKLNRDGIYQINVSTGDCKHCPRGKNERLLERLTQINIMLEHVHLPKMYYHELSPEKWQLLWETPEKSAPGPDMSRRMFFRAAIKQTVDMVMHQSTFDNSTEFISLGEILPLDQSDKPLYPAVPVINPQKCNGCDACMRACPHEVITLQQGLEDTGYKLNTAACTACKICEDICVEDAIEILTWTLQKNNFVSLINQKCQSCGAVFHQPEKNNSSLCIVCSSINHQQNLFQVMS